MKLAIILVHGIGGSNENWAAPVIKTLEDKTLTELTKILKDKSPTAISEVLSIKAVYWKTALEKPQTALQKILSVYFEWVMAQGAIRFIFRKVYRAQSEIVPKFIGDIIGYMGKEGKLGIYEKLDQKLSELALETRADGRTPLTFISHSLGTVIASNYIYDMMDKYRLDNIDQFDERFWFANMFTAGSPIALFSMKFDGPESFNRPVVPESKDGVWVNFLDKDDPIAIPLKPLNEAYRSVVLADKQVDTGWFWWSAHTRYFEKSETLNIIAKKIALDWIAHNQKLPPEKIDKLYHEYEQTVGG